MPGRPATKPTPPFGARLAALRQARRWTQAELAARLGATVKMVTYYEREVAHPTTRTLAKLAAAFGLAPAALLDGPASKRTTPAAKPGPPSQLEQRIAALRELPRERQKVVLQVIDTFLRDARKAS